MAEWWGMGSADREALLPNMANFGGTGAIITKAQLYDD